MEKAKYLIIGNGIAGLSAAIEIRKNHKDASITIISNEKYSTYYRMKLTEALGRDINEEELLIHDMNWYVEKDINLVLDKKVEKIYVEGNKILLNDYREIEYEKLLIATGSSPFIPPISGRYKDGIFTLRGLKDLNTIKNHLRDKERVMVIGGGLLGLEAAWALKGIGKKAIVIESAPFLMPRQLDKELGEKLAEKLRDQGIEVYTSVMVEQIIGDKEVEGIIVDNGESIIADTILMSTGITPNIQLAKETPIETNRGIIVDKHLKTNIENIYAAGDVVEYDNIVIGLWTTAMEQGKIAGNNISGKKMEYTHPKPFSTLRIGNINLFSAGDILNYDNIYEYKKGKDIHHKLFVKEDNIRGAVLFGDIRQMGKIKNIVFSNKDIKEYLKEGFQFQLVK